MVWYNLGASVIRLVLSLMSETDVLLKQPLLSSTVTPPRLGIKMIQLRMLILGYERNLNYTVCYTIIFVRNVCPLSPTAHASAHVHSVEFLLQLSVSRY